MRRLLNWKWRTISSLIIITCCQALKQEIGEECTNKNGIIGICQFSYKCSKNTDLGAICDFDQSIICCAKNISETGPNFGSSNDQKEDAALQTRFGFIPNFFHVPTLPQNTLPSINFFNHQKQKIPNFGSNIFHQNLNTMQYVEDRPYQSYDQDVSVIKTNKNKITTTRPTNKYELHNNNHNSNIENTFEIDQTTKQYQNYNNNNKYPNYYETLVPNQNHNSDTYQSFLPQRPNYYQHENINQPNQNKYFNRNPNYFTSTQKQHENFGYNSQLPNSQINLNNFEENKRPYENNNYHPTSSNIMFPSDSSNNKSSIKFTTTTNKYYEYQNRPNENTRRISEIKCEEYSKPLTTTISALPLSIDTEPKPVSVEKCDSKGIGLIVGGTKAELEEFPHMVALGFRTNTGNPWNCGGTLISEQFVLTAAHCIHSALGNPVRVRLGDLNLQKNNDGANPVEYLVDEIFVHPDYVTTSKYNDIALIRLNKIVKLNNHIRPACLYNKDIIYARKATATGWGSIEYGDRSSDDLLKVDLDIIDNRQCNKLYEAESKTNTLNRGIINSMMCAGDLAGGHDTCLGDSGGPLVIRSEKNACIFNLIGITSFGKFCATENSPGVYTRVSTFLPWIEQIVWPQN